MGGWQQARRPWDEVSSPLSLFPWHLYFSGQG